MESVTWIPHVLEASHLGNPQCPRRQVLGADGNCVQQLGALERWHVQTFYPIAKRR